MGSNFVGIWQRLADVTELIIHVLGMHNADQLAPMIVSVDLSYQLIHAQRVGLGAVVIAQVGGH